MTSTPFDNRPPEETLETELRTTLVEEVRLYHNFNSENLVR